MEEPKLRVERGAKTVARPVMVADGMQRNESNQGKGAKARDSVTNACSLRGTASCDARGETRSRRSNVCWTRQDGDLADDAVAVAVC